MNLSQFTVPKQSTSENINRSHFSTVLSSTMQECSIEESKLPRCNQNHSLEFVCVTCDRFFCARCAMFHIREQKNHEIPTIEEANNSLQNQLEEAANNNRKCIEFELETLKREQSKLEEYILELISSAMQTLSYGPIGKRIEILKGLLIQINEYAFIRSSVSYPLVRQFWKNKLLIKEIELYEKSKIISKEENILQPTKYKFLNLLSDKIKNYLLLNDMNVKGMFYECLIITHTN